MLQPAHRQLLANEVIRDVSLGARKEYGRPQCADRKIGLLRDKAYACAEGIRISPFPRATNQQSHG